MTLCESQPFITLELYFFNYFPLYFFLLKAIRIDINPFTANKVTIILVTKATSGANVLIVRHGELVL